jgi:CheY-like chemotaxis protein
MKRLSVFIVEDNQSKLLEIKKALPNVFRHDVTDTSSIAGAYRLIANREFDLVILDMTFQVSNSKGKQVAKESLAGIEVLQYMDRKNITAPVIVATQHTSFHTPEISGIDSISKLDGLLKELFPKNYFTTVLVDLAGEAWKEQLSDAALRAVAGRGEAQI